MHLILSCLFLMLALNILCKDQNNKNDGTSFTPQEVTAVPGLCALISCTYPVEKKPEKGLLYACSKGKCESETVNSGNSKPGGQHNMEKCSIIINDIKTSDNGMYEFKVEGGEKFKTNQKFKITIQEKPKMDIPPLKEGEQATVNCSAPSPCPQTPPEITWWIKIKGGKAINLKNNITQRITPEILYLSTLTFIPTPELHNATFRCEASYGTKSISKSTTLDVMYVKPLRILGNETVMEGDSLNLSCSVDSNPPSSVPTWTFVGAAGEARKYTSAETLNFTNVSREHAGKYVCSVTYMEKTWTASINISIIYMHHKGRANESTTNATLSQPGQKSSSAAGENVTAKDDSTSTTETISTGIKTFLDNLSLSTILTFLAGMASSAVLFSVALCCWVSCHRVKRHKTLPANPDTAVNLETVQTEVNHTGTNEHTPLHDQRDPETSNRAEATGGAENDAVGETDVGEDNYAAIDYSLLEERTPEEREREPTDTDYAEIKRDGRGKKRRSEAPEDGDDQIGTSHGGTEDQKQEEEVDELYSNTQVLKGFG